MIKRKKRSDFLGKPRIHIRLPEKQIKWLKSKGYKKVSSTIETLIKQEMEEE